MILSYRYPISHKGGLLRQNVNLTTITTLAEERRHWTATQPKFNPRLSQILSKIFLSTNMPPNLTKYCWAFTSRYNNENTKCYSKQYIGRKNTKMAQNFNHGFALIGLIGTGPIILKLDHHLFKSLSAIGLSPWIDWDRFNGFIPAFIISCWKSVLVNFSFSCNAIFLLGLV